MRVILAKSLSKFQTAKEIFILDIWEPGLTSTSVTTFVTQEQKTEYFVFSDN